MRLHREKNKEDCKGNLKFAWTGPQRISEAAAAAAARKRNI